VRNTNTSIDYLLTVAAVPPIALAAASQNRSSQTTAHQGWYLVLKPPQFFNTLSKKCNPCIMHAYFFWNIMSLARALMVMIGRALKVQNSSVYLIL
jgi:hypothetical protein